MNLAANRKPPLFTNKIRGGIVKHKKPFSLLPFQTRELPRGVEILSNHAGALLYEITGSGKTYYAAGLILALRAQYPTQFPANRPVWYIGTKPIRKQCIRVMAEAGITNCQVMTYESLRSSIGDMYIEWKTMIVDNEPHIYPRWRSDVPEIYIPSLVFWDEMQNLKNFTADCTKIQLEISDKQFCKQVGMTATPGSKPNHLRVAFAMTNVCASKNWPSFVTQVVYPKDPDEPTASGMQKLRKYLEPYIINFPELKFEHKGVVHQLLIKPTPEQAQEIKLAFVEYNEVVRLAKNKSPLEGMAAILVASLKLRQKCELLRVPDIARLAVKDEQKGKNVFLLFSFKESLFACYEILKEVYGYKDISIIIGGQSEDERDKNVQMFQTEIAHICLSTYGCGKAGLSLHHTPDNHRPRTGYTPPVWSAEDQIQGAGRISRVNSQSVAHFYGVWYEGTYEERVVKRVKKRIRATCAIKGDIGKDSFASFYSDLPEDDELMVDIKVVQKYEDDESDDEGIEEGSAKFVEFDTDDTPFSETVNHNIDIEI